MLHSLQRAEPHMIRTGTALTYHSNRAKRAMAIYEFMKTGPTLNPVHCSQQFDILFAVHRGKQSPSEHVGTFVQAGVSEEELLSWPRQITSLNVKAQDSIPQAFSHCINIFNSNIIATSITNHSLYLKLASFVYEFHFFSKQCGEK